MINETKEAGRKMRFEEQMLDAERNKAAREQYEAELQRRKQNKLENQRHLSDLYIMQSKTQTEKQMKQVSILH